jgi:hypothetical protein
MVVEELVRMVVVGLERTALVLALVWLADDRWWAVAEWAPATAASRRALDVAQQLGL